MLLGQSSAKRPVELGWLLLLGILWGAPYALTKISLETIPPITLVAARVSLAAAALWLIVALRGCELPRDRNLIGRLVGQGVITCVIPYTLIAFGQQAVDSALAAILNSSTPIFVCLIGVLWSRHERMTSRKIAGPAIGFAGVVLIAGASALSGLGAQAIGQAAIIVATISSAFSVIIGRRFGAMAPEVVAASMLTSAAALLLPLCLIEAPWTISPSLPSVAALFANAFIATAFGFVIYFRLIRTIGSIATASAGYLKPAVGVLIGVLIFGEPFTVVTALGLIAILVGVAIINIRIRRPGHSQENTPPYAKDRIA